MSIISPSNDDVDLVILLKKHTDGKVRLEPKWTIPHWFRTTPEAVTSTWVQTLPKIKYFIQNIWQDMM